jgi:hypothetical protein
MASISAAELKSFGKELEKFKKTLKPAQRKLLEAILEIAWETTTEEASLARGFDGSFKAKDAKLIFEYGQHGFVKLPKRIRAKMIRG